MFDLMMFVLIVINFCLCLWNRNIEGFCGWGIALYYMLTYRNIKNELDEYQKKDK